MRAVSANVLRVRALAGAALALSLAAWGAELQPGAPGAAPQGSADSGRRLFSGEVRFRNGGPPCAACHSTSGIPFPNGGTLGPDLSGAYSKLGHEGITVALQTLYFPTMARIFGRRLLTPQEQADLAAFFAQVQAQAPARDLTGWFAAAAAAGFLVLLGLSWLAGRGRVRGVRRPMVEAALRSRREHP